ncbi:MAG: hypothetical protein ACM3NO_00665, partial [Deltaproteobacteria bacterium]
MKRFLIGRAVRVSIPALILFVSAAGNAAAQTAAPQLDKPSASITEEVSRAGVFFRADAPRVLRNSQDPFLPIFLEVINGVEQESRSNLAQLARKISRDPVQL